MLSRDRIEVRHGEVAALEQVVAETGAHPLARRRLPGYGLERGERVGARAIGAVSDVQEQVRG